MVDVIAYLYFLDYLGTPGNPLEGEKVFQTKACINCHSLKRILRLMNPSKQKNRLIWSVRCGIMYLICTKL